MRMRVAATVAILLAIGTLALRGQADAAPKPKMISDTWELNIKAEQPQPILVRVPGQAKRQLFWYMRYKLTNRTGAKQIFVPEFLMYTDTGQVLRAGQGIPDNVFTDIKKHHREPLLNNMAAMTGVILHGEDNSKLGVAIWPDFDAKAGRFDIFIGGLSGETAKIKLPVPVEVEEKIPGTRKHIKVIKNTASLTKTLKLTYSSHGEAAGRINKGVKKEDEKWLMR